MWVELRMARGPLGAARYVAFTMMRSRWARRALVRGALGMAAIGVLAAALFAGGGSSELSVLCSNDERTCQALIDAFADDQQRVSLVRLPTSQALARLRQDRDAPEFDVWIGGPAEAYVEAAGWGLLERAPGRSPSSFDDPGGRWRGIYGGILAFCVADSIEAPTSWSELLRSDLRGRVVISNPLTSGTAATMLGVQLARTGSLDDTMSYLRALAAQTAHLTESGTAPARLVAEGRADVAVAFAPYCDRLRSRAVAVRTVYPSDGTGYEVGAAALLRGARHPVEARRFFLFVTSPNGQLIAARSSTQNPIDKGLDGNLADELEALEVPVIADDVTANSRVRGDLIAAWIQEVRDGEY